MTKYALAAALVAAAAFLSGCTADTSEKTESSEDAVVGGEAGKGIAFDDGTEAEEPLPPLEGDGAQGTVKAKDLVQSSAAVNVKPTFDVPKPLLSERSR